MRIRIDDLGVFTGLGLIAFGNEIEEVRRFLNRVGALGSHRAARSGGEVNSTGTVEAVADLRGVSVAPMAELADCGGPGSTATTAYDGTGLDGRRALQSDEFGAFTSLSRPAVSLPELEYARFWSALGGRVDTLIQSID